MILVDEYDAPMLDSNNNTELQIEIRDIMRDFFSPLKAQGQYMRHYRTRGTHTANRYRTDGSSQ